MADRIHDYELVVIALPELDEQAVASLNERVNGWITSAGGTVANTDVWGRRRLTYPIRKHTDGIYVQ